MNRLLIALSLLALTALPTRATAGAFDTCEGMALFTRAVVSARQNGVPAKDLVARMYGVQNSTQVDITIATSLINIVYLMTKEELQVAEKGIYAGCMSVRN